MSPANVAQWLVIVFGSLLSTLLVLLISLKLHDTATQWSQKRACRMNGTWVVEESGTEWRCLRESSGIGERIRVLREELGR